MLKPLIRTTILAGILFFLLVYLGMKYHWGDALKRADNPKNTELVIPPQKTVPVLLENSESAIISEAGGAGNFQPKILKDAPKDTLLGAMTKDQIALHCQQFYSESLGINAEEGIDLLIGNCVVSNYQEPFEVSMKTPQNIQQDLSKKLQATNNCRRQILQMYDNTLSGVETQLAIGICVSNQISQ